MVNYIGNYTNPQASLWNNVISASDSYLYNSFHGLSPLLTPTVLSSLPADKIGIDYQWDRGFFIGFSPVTMSAATMHPLAQYQFLNNPTTYFNAVPIAQQAMFFREYNHSAITTLVNGLSTSGSVQLGCQRLVKPTWAAWKAAIYPEGTAGFNTDNLTDGAGYVADNVLDCSLGVIKRSGHNVTFNDISTAEHVQPFKPIDVFVINDLTWDTTNWDKYYVVRVHNCARVAITATFGSAVAGMGPGNSRCFQKVNGTWQVEGFYFHYMHSGSSARYLDLGESNTGGAACFQPGICFDVMHTAKYLMYTFESIGTPVAGNSMNFSADPDASKFWNYAPIANNATYSAIPPANTVPSGGYFGQLNSSTMLGDLLVNKGNFLLYFSNFPVSGSGGYYTVPFTGFGNLSASLSHYTSSGLGIRTYVQDTSAAGVAGTVNNTEIFGTVNGLVAQGCIADLSSPLSTFLTKGQCPAIELGVSQSSDPNSIIYPWLKFSCVSVTQTETNNIIFGPNNAITNSVAQWYPTQINKIFLPNNTVSDVESWITTTVQSGSIVSVSNFGLLSTAFGPVLTWNETWPIQAGFNTYAPFMGIVNNWSSDGDKLVKIFNVQITGSNFNVFRGIYIQDTIWTGFGSQPFPIFPRVNDYTSTFTLYGLMNPPISKMLKWNYPRVDQAYSLARWFYHDSGSGPMMPNWSAYFNTSNYADSKYVNSLIDGGSGPWWNDTLSQDENVWDDTLSFYESSSITVDKPNGYYTGTDGTQAMVNIKKGISFPHAYSQGSDCLGPLAAWLGGAGTFGWQNPPDLPAGSVPIRGDTILNSLLLNGKIDGQQNTPNLLTCEREQINALTSLVNSQVSGKYFSTLFNVLPDAAGGANIFFPQYMGPNSNITLDGGWQVVPRDMFYGWYTGTTTPDPSAYIASLGIPIHTVYGNSLGGTANTMSYITILDTGDVYNNFNIPFVIDTVAYPARWTIDGTTPQGGYYTPDVSGSYLVACNYYTNNGFTPICSPISQCSQPNENQMGSNEFPIPNTSGSIVSSALCVQRLGCQDAIVSVIARNYWYYDPPSGNYIPNNSMEGAPTETHLISGGPGLIYDTSFMTELDFGLVQLTQLG